MTKRMIYKHTLSDKSDLIRSSKDYKTIPIGEKTPKGWYDTPEKAFKAKPPKKDDNPQKVDDDI